MFGGLAAAAAGVALSTYAVRSETQNNPVVEEQRMDYPYAYLAGTLMFSAGTITALASGWSLDKEESPKRY